MKKKKFFIGLIYFIAISYGTYLFLLPALISNDTFNSFICNKIQEKTNIEVIIKKPTLKTHIKPLLKISANSIIAKNQKEVLLDIDNFELEISLRKILEKELSIKKLYANKIYVDTNKILEKLSKHNHHTKNKEKSNFKINILSSLLWVENCLIKGNLHPDTEFIFSGKNLRIDDKRNPKYVKFDINLLLKKENELINLNINDNDKFYIQNKKLIIEECPLYINNSLIKIHTIASKENITVSLFAKDFNISDFATLLSSNIFIPNGKEILAEIRNIKGKTDFYITINKNELNGEIKLKSLTLNLKSLSNLPVTLNTGSIKIKPENITLNNISGYYGNSKYNNILITGNIRDYLKTVISNIEFSTVITNDFTKNYLSKILGIQITMTGTKPVNTLIKLDTKNSDIDITCLAKLPTGNDILLEGASLSPENYDRAIKAIMHLRKNILNLESVNYYVAQTLNRESKVKPILTLQGNIDVTNSNILDFGFNIPKPLPSEFLNVILGQPVFKKGTIAGQLEYINKNNTPVLNGELSANKVVIPSQRLFIRNCSLKTDNQFLHLSSNGKFRRSEYNFSGKFLNKIAFPIIIKNLNLDLEYIDIEKILTSILNPETENEAIAQEEFLNTADKNSQNDNSDIAALKFYPNILVIEKAALNLKKGQYKEINFGNLLATATLDKTGNLKINSNRFDFAEGSSSAQIMCELAKPRFLVTLGAKDINSDILATALLNLKREITGRASGIISLETDSSLKLNGEMKFAIKDGTIQKVGLVEYALNFVSLFRNPIAMMSPSLLFDIVNIPEGKFEKIKGELSIQNNIIKRIKIETTAPQLATLIMGRFNLETRDASLRIYTKFATKRKGFTGFLRKISLNSLANRIPLGNNIAENYYAAELEMLPPIDADEKDCQVFLTTVDGDIERNNFLSSLKKIK